MIGSRRSFTSLIRPRITPSTIAAAQPVTKPTPTRARLIATCRKISPLRAIGSMVSNTTSGGGIRKGLNTTVERNCHSAKATTIDPTKSASVRARPSTITPPPAGSRPA